MKADKGNGGADILIFVVLKAAWLTKVGGGRRMAMHSWVSYMHRHREDRNINLDAIVKKRGSVAMMMAGKVPGEGKKHEKSTSNGVRRRIHVAL